MAGLSSFCLICDQNCSQPSHAKIVTGKHDEILAEIHVYFVLQKLLQIPDSSCEQLISDHGGTLSQWSDAFCTQCSSVIEEAKEVSLQISSLVSKFQCLQQRLQDKVLSLSEVSQTSLSSSGFSADLRKLCFEHVQFVKGSRLNEHDDEGDPSEENEDQAELSTNSEASLESQHRMHSSQFERSCSSPMMIPSELSFSGVKSSPASLRGERLMDDMPEDTGFLDPGSVVQVVSDISSSKSKLETLHHAPESLHTSKRKRTRMNENETYVPESSLVSGFDHSSTKKSAFFKKIMELHSSQAKNTVLIPKDKYRKIVIDLKVLRDTGTRTKFISNYYKRYELLEYRDTLTLVRSGTQKRVVAAEDLYDVINSAHISTNHGGRDSILKFLKDEFFNVTKHQVNTFLSICEGCAMKRIRKR